MTSVSSSTPGSCSRSRSGGGWGLRRWIDAAVPLGRTSGGGAAGAQGARAGARDAARCRLIDDCEILRAGRTEAILGDRAMAPSTLGTLLRSFTFGHVRQLDRVFGQLLRRAWQAGAGPGAGRLVIDIDSFVGEVHGHRKQGAGYGYTRQARLPPAARDARRHQRGLARAPAQGPGQHAARRAALRRRAARPRPPRRRRRSDPAAAPTRGSGTTRSSRACASRAAATRSASRCTRSSRHRSR